MTISNIASSSIDAATVSGLVPSFQSVIKNAVNSIVYYGLPATSYVYVSKVVSSSGSTLYGSRALEVTADDRQLQSSSFLTVTFSLYLSPSAATTLSGTLSSTISSKLGMYLLSESSISTGVKSALASASVSVSPLSYVSNGITYYYSTSSSSYSSVSGGSSTSYPSSANLDVNVKGIGIDDVDKVRNSTALFFERSMSTARKSLLTQRPPITPPFYFRPNLPLPLVSLPP